MAKIKKEKEKERVAREDFTDEQLDELDKELEPYRSSVKINNEPAQILTLGGQLAFMRDKGLIKVGGALNKRMNCLSECPHWGVCKDMVVDYQEFENKMKALKFRKGKTEFAKQMELKQLDNDNQIDESKGL